MRCRDSIYMHKDAGSGIAMGPAWDFNEAFGECCGYPLEGYKDNGRSGPGVAGGGSISPNGWRFLICEDPDRCLVEPTDGVSMWFRRMWNDTRFSGAAASRWAELRAEAWSDATISSLISGTAVKARPAGLNGRENGGGRWCIEACPSHVDLPMRTGLSQLHRAIGQHRKVCVRVRPPAAALQIHPAVTRDYKVYSKVLLKSWYASTEAQWTSGESACMPSL